MRRPVGAALVTAAALAAAYSLSPLTVIFAGVMVLLLSAAVRGVSGTERTWVFGSLGIALLVRLVALVAIYVTTNPLHEDFNALFGDGRYSIERSIWILNDWNGVSIEPLRWLGIYAHYGTIEYDRALALIQWFLGPSPYGLTLISVAAFFGGAVLLYRISRPTYGPAAATAGLVVLLFWPTFVVWSVSMLKESVHLLLSAVAVAAAVQAARVHRWRQRLLLAGAVGAAVWLIASVRGGSRLILLATVLLGYATFAGTRRSAVIAALAVAAVIGSTTVMARHDVRVRSQAEIIDAVHYHVGHVESLGKSYRAADQYFYDAWPHAPMVNFDEGARYLLRSAAMFVAVPLPSHVVSPFEILLLPQHFTWWLLVVLACVGTVVGLRRDALLTGMLAGYCLIGLTVIAPYSGNIGTLIRHRDMIVPFLTWLSALGAVGALRALAQERHASH
jgi:hypothetical protein